MHEIRNSLGRGARRIGSKKNTYRIVSGWEFLPGMISVGVFLWGKKISKSNDFIVC